PTPALLSLACDPSGATIASSSSTGHRGRRSGRQQDPSAAPSCRWTRRSASLQRRVSSGRAHVFDRKKMRKVELRGVYFRTHLVLQNPTNSNDDRNFSKNQHLEAVDE